MSKKYIRDKKGRFSSLKIKINNILKKLFLIGVVIMLGAGVYGYASYDASIKSQNEINKLKSQIENGEMIKDTNAGIVARIAKITDEEDFDLDLAIKIAGCESYLNPYFVKVNQDGSIDRGIFAFNSRHYKDVSNECAFSIECATRKFISEAKEGKINNWLCYKKIK